MEKHLREPYIFREHLFEVGELSVLLMRILEVFELLDWPFSSNGQEYLPINAAEVEKIGGEE